MIKNAILSIIMILSLAFCVSATGNLTLTPNTITYSAISTQTVSGTISLTNSNVNDSLSISIPATIDFVGTVSNITGVGLSYNVSNPHSLSNLSSESVNYSFTVPTNTTVGSYTGIINITDGVGNYDMQTITLNVQAISESIQITQSISQATIIRSSSQDATTKFKIKNNGNIALNGITFTASDLVQNSTVSISSANIRVNDEASLNLAIGEEKELTVKVTPSPAYTLGNYNCNVTINYGTAKTSVQSYTAVVRDASTILSVPSSVVLGSSSGQLRNQNVTSQFSITNGGVTGDSGLTGMTVSSTAASKYNVIFSKDNTNFYTSLDIGSIAVTTTQTVYVKGFIPSDENGGSQDIGDILIRSNEANATISSFTINPEMMLSIEKFDVDVSGDTDTSMSNGETIKYKAKPGDKVVISIKFKNKYSSSSDVDINNIDIQATVEEIDDGDDLEIDTTSFDLGPGDSKTVSLEFTVPQKVDSSTYTIRVNVEAEDDNNANQNTEWTSRLTVDKDSHDLKIMKAEFGQSSLQCIRATTFTVNVLNIGDTEEPEGVIVISAPQIGLNDRINFQFDNNIDQDDIEFSKTYPLDLKNVAPGTYKAEVSAYYSDDVLSDKSTATITVSACNDRPIQVVNESRNNTAAIILEQRTNGIIQNGGSIAQEITDTQHKPLLDSKSSALLLILANIAVIGIVIFLVFKFLIKPKN